MDSINRYQKFTSNSEMKTMPFIKIRVKGSDKSIIWNKSTNRLDVLSQRYYGVPDAGWLIMMANAQYGIDEFDIPDGELVIIPYPYKTSIQSYLDEIVRFDAKFGI
jgi:hypothetical protein